MTCNARERQNAYDDVVGSCGDDVVADRVECELMKVYVDEFDG